MNTVLFPNATIGFSEKLFLVYNGYMCLMDDTLILSTSQNKCIEKAKILVKFCNNSGKIINANKTKFMVIIENTEDNDLI